MSAVVWSGPDKTGEVHHDQNDDDDQNDATAADLVRIPSPFNSEILTYQKKELGPRLINIPGLR